VREQDWYLVKALAPEVPAFTAVKEELCVQAAIRKGDLKEVAKALEIQCGAPDSQHLGTLRVAMDMGDPHIVELVLADPRTDIKAAEMERALKSGNSGLITKMMDRAGLRCQREVLRNLFTNQALQVHADACKAFIAAYPHPHEIIDEGQTPLDLAMRHGLDGLVDTLLERPDFRHTLAIFAALKGGRADVVRKVMGAASEADLRVVMTTLFSSAGEPYRQHKAAYRAFIAEYPNPNERSKKGRTLLVMAVRGNWTEMVDALLARPTIDVNAGSTHEGFVHGDTPLHTAARAEQVNDAIVEKLLGHPDVDADAKNSAGQRARDLADRSSRLFRLLEARSDRDTPGGVEAVLPRTEHGPSQEPLHDAQAGPSGTTPAQ
jgi:ankyrin repeat protein